MRLAFCGKGGSGKSTLCSLFARYMASQKHPVLVIDGDINQHVGNAIGFSDDEIEALPKMGMDQDMLRTYMRGTNQRIAGPDKMVEATPAGRGSGLVYLDRQNPVMEKYSVEKNGIRFMAVGGHDEKDVGATCYHKFTGMFGLFLNHLVDTNTDYVLGDMCAGADPFASSSLASRFDVIVLVVEPTLKSVGVYDQCRKYAEPYGIRLLVIGNKIESDEDLNFIKSRTGRDYLTGFSRSEFVRQLEKGQFGNLADLEPANLEVLRTIARTVGSLQRDWRQYQQVGYNFLKVASEAWADTYMDTDIMGQFDPDFRYEDYLPQGNKQAA